MVKIIFSADLNWFWVIKLGYLGFCMAVTKWYGFGSVIKTEEYNTFVGRSGCSEQ